MAYDLRAPLHRIYGQYQAAFTAYQEECNVELRSLEHLARLVHATEHPFEPGVMIDPLPIPAFLQTPIMPTQSTDSVPDLRSTILEIKKGSRRRERRARVCVEGGKQPLARPDQQPTPSVAESLVLKHQQEMERELQQRVADLLLQETELQNRLLSIETEYNTLAERLQELRRKQEEYDSLTESLRRQEATLEDKRAKVQATIGELRSLQEQKNDFECKFVVERARCEEELTQLQEQLSKVRADLQSAEKEKESVLVSLELTSQQTLDAASQLTDLTSDLQHSLPQTMTDLEHAEFVQSNGDALRRSVLSLLSKTNSRVESADFTEKPKEGAESAQEELEPEKKADITKEFMLALDTLRDQLKLSDTLAEEKESEPPLHQTYHIPEEYDPELSGSRVPVAEWALGDLLERCIRDTQAINPDSIFGLPQKATVHDLFGITNHPFDNRMRQTQNWGNDKLTQREVDQYNTRMGFRKKGDKGGTP